jgi:Putative NADPH-quinone reductase (modulator of drug activity B)
MNVGIIIHSQTGHTYSAALKLQEKLAAKGHRATVEKIVPVDDKPHPGIKNPQLKTNPGITGYDGLVFAAPVWAFSLSPILKTYLSGVSSLKGKKIAAFVTMGAPWAWVGNRAIKQIKQYCEAKDGTVTAAAIAGRDGNDPKTLQAMVEKLAEIF